ncbi:hypothetical protein B9Z51_16985, partial [Limnohabitans sp. T6-5]|uniref:Ig-like domain-containing protein n=1 Tax=Limnohabitans sp. T6-5 TaxID=1100724 RepID=UPI000DD29FA0
MTINNNNFTLNLGVFATQPLTLVGADLTAATTLLQTGQSLMVDEAIRKSLTAHIVMLGAQANTDPQKAVQELLDVAANELAAAVPELLLAKPATAQALVQLGADKTSALMVQWLGFADHVSAAMQAQHSAPTLISAFQNAAPDTALLKTFSADALWPVLPNTPVAFDPSMLRDTLLANMPHLIPMTPTDTTGSTPMTDPTLTLTDPGLVTGLSTQVALDLSALVQSASVQAALQTAVDSAITGNKLPLIAPTLVDPVLYAEVTTAAVLTDPALLKVIDTVIQNPAFASGVGSVGLPQMRNLLVKQLGIGTTITETLVSQGANAQLVQQIGTQMNSTAVNQIMVDSIPVAMADGTTTVPNPIAMPTNTPSVTNTVTNTTTAGNTAMNDSTTPFIAIASSKNNLAVGETTTLSFTLSEVSTNFTASDVTAIGGTLSNFTGSGTSYSATFTPSANVSSAFVMVGSDTFSNATGTYNKDGADANNAASLSVGLLCNTNAPADTTAPTVMISNTKTRVRPGDTDLITFTLSEASSNFTQSDVTVIGGTLSGWTQSATNPLVYTATFTPNANALSAALYIASESFTDAAGNFNQDGMELNNMASIAIQCKIDTTPPTIAVSADRAALAAGQTAVVTFTLSELATDFTASDVTVMGGTLSGFTQSATNPLVYTATFTPAVGSISGAVYVASNKFTDASGNANADGNDTNNAVSFTLDTAAPTIAITSDKTGLKAGDTATITFTLSEISTNFALSDVAVTGGTLSGFAQSATDPHVYTATFTPAAGSTAATVSVASNKFSDASGNQNTDGADANNTVSLSVDTTPPTVIVSSLKSSLGAGETATVTFTLSEASVNFTAADVTVVGGTLSNFAGSGTSYTATFTPTAGASTASVKVDSNRFTDAAGNNNQDGADANNTVSFNLDSTPPTIIVSTDKVDLLQGQTATITFTLSEASSNFTLGDISVSGGTLSNFQGSGTSYTATFTPSATASSAMILVSSNTFSDAAGNNNKDGADLNNAVSLKTNCPPDTTPVTPPAADTTAPTVAISSDKTMLAAGEAATVSFTFSEATSDFALTDITVIGGTMSNLVRNPANPLVYTATFTPFATTQGAMVLVSSGQFSDAAGNFNTDGADLNNAVSLGFNCGCADTTAPTIAISAPKTVLAAGEVTTVTFVLSEDSTDFSLADITLLGGTLSNFVGSGKVYTATFTPAPTAKSAMMFVASDKFTDAAGNFNKDGADVNNAWSFGFQCTPTAVAPAAPGAILNAISDSGTQGDNTTTDNTPTLSGTGTPGDTISIKDAAGNVIATAVVAANGTWMATPVNPLPLGLNNLSVIETNPAGMASAPTALPLTIQSAVVPVAPTAPAAILNAISDSGAQGDNTTNDTTPTLSGTGTPGDTISIKDAAGNVIATAVVAANGTWMATPATALPQGLNNLSVIETGPTGLASAPTPLPITIDSAAPTIAVSAPKGVLAAGEATTITFTLSDAASDFSVSDITVIGGTLSGFTKSPTNPLVYTATFTPTAGAHSAMVFVGNDKFTDASGNLNQDGAELNNLASFSINAAAVTPVAPAAPAAILDPISDSGAKGDQLTNDTTPTISGTGTPGDTIAIKDPAGNTIATAIVQPNGTWAATPVNPLPQGLNNLSVVETNPAGLSSPATPLPITIDSVAPSPLGAILNPISNSGLTTDNITNDTTPTISGSGTPGDTIAIKDAAGNTIATAVVAANGTWTATPANPLPQGLNNLSVVETSPTGATSTAQLPIVIDSAAPTIALSTNASALTTGQAATVTFTLSEASADFTAADITVIGGTITGLTQSPTNPLVYTATFTPAAGASSAAVLVTSNKFSDAAGNINLDGADTNNALSYSITAGPALTPLTAAIDPTSDSGTKGDGKTNDTTPTLSGTGTPGDTIAIKDAAGTVIATATVGPNGTWTATPANPLPQGLNNLSVVETSPSGSTSTQPLPLTIDSGAPTVAISTSASTLAAGQTATVTFTLSEAASDFTASDITVMGGSLTGLVQSPTNPLVYTATFTPTAGAQSAMLFITSDKFADAAGNLNKDGADTNNIASFSISAPVPNAPAAPAAILDPISDSGTQGDKATTDTTPTLSGTGVPGDTITVKDPQGNVIATATVQPNGTWAATPVNPLPLGLNNLSVTETNPQGATSAPTALPITIQAETIAAPGAKLDLSSDTGTVGDSTTTDTTPTLSGTGVPGDTIAVKDPQGNVIATATVAPDGTWSATPTSALPLGLQNLSVVQTSPTGIASAPTPLPITIVAPAAGVLTAALSGPSDSGVVGDNTTNDTTPTLTGTGTPGDTVSITNAAGQVIATATVQPDGTWAATPTTALPAGTNPLTVVATNPAGQITASNVLPIAIVIDPIAPAAPGAILDPISDSGTVGDKATTDNTPTLSGTGTPGDTIAVKDPAGNVIATATVQPDGTWAATPTTPLPLGTNNLSVVETDPAGNASLPTPLPLTIQAPVGVLVIQGGVYAGLVTTDPTLTTPVVTTPPTDSTGTGTGTPTGTTNDPGLVNPGTVAPTLLTPGLPSNPITTNTNGGATVFVYDNTGALMGQTTLASDGTWRIDIANKQDYRGAVLVKVVDVNGTAVNYIDEVSAAGKSFDTTLRAQGVAEVGLPNFQVPDSLNSVLTVYITPVTELAVRTAGVTDTATAPASVMAIVTANTNVASALGMAGVDITAPPTTTNSADFTATDRYDANGVVILTDAEKYGLVLAKLSGLDSVKGNIDASLDALQGQILPGGTLSAAGAALVDAGRIVALEALKGTTDGTAPENTFTIDTPLNRWLLGDITIVEQTVTPTGAVLTGQALPGSTVTVKLPGGGTTTAVADATGTFTVPLTTAQLPAAGQAITFTGTDGLTQPAATIHALPAAPTAAIALISDSGAVGDGKTTDNTPTLTGNGTPGDTITITDPQGNVIATAVVAPNGTWAATPTDPLPLGLNNLSVTQTDPEGFVSAPTALPVTIEAGAGPAAPAAVLDPTSDSGKLLDSTTNDTTPTLSGTGTAGDTITIKDPQGNVIGTAVVAANGTWAITPTTPLPLGLNNLSVTETNPAGISSPATPLPVTIDTTAPAAPGAVLDPTSDTGVQGDKTTTDTTPTLSGTGTPGDTITVKDPQGNVIGTAVVAANGTWAITPTTPLPLGLNALTATATDPAGNTSAPAPLPVTIVPGTLAAPVAKLDLSSDTGTVGDSTTTDTTPTLSGTGTPGDTIAIKDPQGNVIATATVAADGTWAATPTTALPLGLNNLTVTETNPAGVSSPAAPLPVTIQALPAGTLTATLAATSDSGVVGDSITNDTTPTLTGTGIPGDTIAIKNAAGQVIATTVVAANGTWTATPTTALPQGINTLLVSQTSPSGSVIDAVLPVTIVVDAVVPVSPAAVLAPISDSGKLLDSTTNDNTPTLSGNGTPGDTITIKDPQGNVIATTVVAANGTWAATPTTALPDGLINLAVTATDPAGNTSAPTPLPITIDTTPPAAPAAVLDPTSDSGKLLDSTTSDNTPTLSGGGATPGDTITIKDPQGNVIGTAVVAANGTWAVTPTTALPDGLINLAVTATDPAGNTSAPTPLPITIDTTPPAAPAAVLDPTSDSGKLLDSTTSDNTPTLSGAGATPGDTITIKDPQGNVIGTAVVAANGTWAVTPTTALPDGLIPLSVTAT